jgi:predicted O-methyltransferase YrrM
VSGRLPDNLALLYSRYSEEVIESILPGDTFDVDGIEFVCKYMPESTPERFYIVKSLDLVDRYRALCATYEGGSIVELGIAEGGSTALLALLARPAKLIAVDLEPVSSDALAEFIEARGLSSSVRTHYGLDQSDRRALARVVDDDLEGRRLDLVIDDCSHQYEPTLASFETLFPRLRPGGRYVIEDWNADHVMRDAIRAQLSDTSDPEHDARIEQFRAALASLSAEERARPGRVPLTRLALELFVARCSRTDAIAEVSADEFWITVVRGEASLDSSTFRLADHYNDHFGFIPGGGSQG